MQAAVLSNDVFFLDENHGWVVGDTMWRTTDGGENWTRTPMFGVDHLTSVTFADTNIGWALERRGGVLRSENGGMSWNRTSPNSGRTGVKTTCTRPRQHDECMACVD